MTTRQISNDKTRETLITKAKKKCLPVPKQ